ncbi:hypothetical protein CbuRSA425_08625 [Coxiella burnetii]|nr:hypothetical protein B7L74_08710 [Coxiella burnetii]ARK27901.1 hypothetical protein BMW92_08475 [Coxiella burnetii]OYK83800.1 hypothetical protein CbuRSA315_08620 [Coxiella burnetii]OYK87616.1 hypothetical protein CbuRSA345_08620 [Coxiella burnetii]OYK90187.1 hypothetical protein CbuRSA338_08640 [Coxiella burnetii]
MGASLKKNDTIILFWNSAKGGKMPNFTEVIESLCASDMAPGLTAEEVAAQMPKIISNSDWWKVDLEKFHPVEELQLLINEFISHINHIKKGDPTRFVAFTLLDVLALLNILPVRSLLRALMNGFGRISGVLIIKMNRLERS